MLGRFNGKNHISLFNINSKNIFTMNTFINILTSKATWVVIGMVVLAILLALLIEKNVENDFLPILGAIPSLAIWYFYFVKPTIKK